MDEFVIQEIHLPTGNKVIEKLVSFTISHKLQVMKLNGFETQRLIGKNLKEVNITGGNIFLLDQSVLVLSDISSQEISVDEIFGKVEESEEIETEVNTHQILFLDRLFTKLIKLFFIDWLIEKLSIVISNQFAMSQGQAKSLLKRELKIPLTSTERSQLYDLRKKLAKYLPLVKHFQHYLLETNNVNPR